MNESNNTTLVTIKYDRRDDLGYNLISLYNILFGISCVTVRLGILVNIVFMVGIIFRAKKVFNINGHALLVSCLTQIILAVVQGPIRVYYYYHQNDCLSSWSYFYFIVVIVVSIHLVFIFIMLVSLWVSSFLINTNVWSLVFAWYFWHIYPVLSDINELPFRDHDLCIPKMCM
jgi:hypothetical protein